MFTNILCFVTGAAVGAGVMWYYWRRYKTTDAFKEEVSQRAEQVKDLVNDVTKQQKEK